MASMSNQRASLLDSSSSNSHWKYDVFLSFRGEDTRNKFTDHLYAALNQRGIVVFRDDEKLERGKSIAPELVKAITESRFSIVVFSRNYASSRWCLDELVKIVECMSKEEQVVLPVFYDVDPSEVRKQTGSFQEAFAKHEETFMENIKKVQEWRTAMTEVANLSGWDLKDGSEAKLIQDIVEEIWCQLSHTFPSVVDGLVGIDSRLMELNTYLGEGLNDVRFIGICGMGGIGKTTIARVVYERSHQFESSCFLLNVREVSEKLGLIHLQYQLLSEVLKESNINVLNVYRGVDMIRGRLRYKKVLLILDDVDNSKQLKMLAEDRAWFGPGSRIIITTRDEHLLREHGVDMIYKAKGLDNDESLTLFSQKAFKLHHPARDYEGLSMRVLNYAKGVPLALEVFGSFLCGRSINVWKSALDRLEKNPNKEILDILQVSFDGLEEMDKKIFLDVACFFNGHDKYHVTEILDACGFYPGIGIQVLIDKSLIKVLENKLWMHDLLQIMGWEIVRRECIEEPGKRSRLWADKDVNHMLMKNTGTDAVEAIVIDIVEHREAQWNTDSFSKMSKLRLLRIHNVHLYQGPKCLSSELRCLEWHGYPSICLPFSFHPDKLVELNMCYSGIKQLWKGKKALENLKFMTLSHSQNLTETPDFTGIPNLETLILEGCTRLCEVHRSIGLLRKLILLNLKDCKSLRSLPSITQMESLEIFILSSCLKVRKLPEITETMGLLSELYLDGTAIKELPSSIEHLTGLVLLNLRDCKNLVSLPSNIYALKSLTSLILSGCSKFRKFPEIIKKMELLSKLYLDGTAIEELPSSIEHLTDLVLLNLRDCKNLVSLPSSIYGWKSLKSLILSGCCKLQNLPENLGQVECLEQLDISGTAVRQPPSSIFLLKNLKELSFRGCKGPPSNSWLSPFAFLSMQRKSPESMPLMLPSLSGLCSLTKLDLSDCNLGEGAIPNDIGCLSSLIKLNLSSNNFVSLPTSINRLSQLWELEVKNCKRLCSLSKLPLNLKFVWASACTSLEMLPDPLKHYNTEGTYFYCDGCFKLVENQGYNSMATRMLKRHFQGVSNLRRRFDIIIPGNEIPEWFSYQSEGNEVTIQKSPLLDNKKKLIGFALCSIFVLHQHPPVINYNSFTHGVMCDVKANDRCFDSMGSAAFHLKEKLGQALTSHLWLLYLPCEYICDSEKLLSELDQASHIGLSVRPCLGPGLEVKRVGVRPIYEQDLVELNQTMDQYSTSTFETFNDLHQDFDGSTALDGVMIKRINDEAGPSESDYFDDEPHPKRSKY